MADLGQIYPEKRIQMFEFMLLLCSFSEQETLPSQKKGI